VVHFFQGTDKQESFNAILYRIASSSGLLVLELFWISAELLFQTSAEFDESFRKYKRQQPRQMAQITASGIFRGRNSCQET